MNLDLYINFIKGLFGKDNWIYKLVFCLIAPSYLIIYYVSDSLFITTDIIKLLILCIIINIALLAFLSIIEIQLHINDRNTELTKLTEEYMNIKHLLENEDDNIINHENNDKLLIDLAKKFTKIEHYYIDIIETVFSHEVALCIYICIIKVTDIILFRNQNRTHKMIYILLYFIIVYGISSINTFIKNKKNYKKQLSKEKMSN